MISFSTEVKTSGFVVGDACITGLKMGIISRAIMISGAMIIIPSTSRLIIVMREDKLLNFTI